MLNALINQNIPLPYVKLLQHIYDSNTSNIRLHTDSPCFKLNRGVRQGDTISPKLFTACLEEVFKKLNWSKFGIQIGDKNLTNLRFANDIILLSKSPEELQLMINDLSKVSKEVGPEINGSETKIMYNRLDAKKKIVAEGVELELVDKYTCLD